MPSVMLRSSTVNAVFEELREATAKGYDAAHDDAHGSGHLVSLAVDRLTRMGEYPTDEAVKHEIVVAIGLLFNAVDVIDRAQEVETIPVYHEAGMHGTDHIARNLPDDAAPGGAS